MEDVLAQMTDDCVYEGSVGPEPGTTWRGRAEVAAGLAAMFELDRGAASTTGEALVVGDQAAWEWTYRWPTASGDRTVRGCDFFEFRDGLVCRKAGYRRCTAASSDDKSSPA